MKNPNNTWAVNQFGGNPLGGNLGAWGGMSGTMMQEGKEVHVHCGGYDVVNSMQT